jgi:hypothetical protein
MYSLALEATQEVSLLRMMRIGADVCKVRTGVCLFQKNGPIRQVPAPQKSKPMPINDDGKSTMPR